MRFILSAVLFALPLAAWTQTVYTEAEAVRLGLARGEVAALEQGAVQAAEAEAVATSQLPNPSLSYSREQLGNAPETVEEGWMLSQTFDFSGRRALRREAAGRRVDLALADNAARRAEISAEIRRRFHDVLFRQELIRATEAWVRRFDRVEGAVDTLARAGEASGYDRRRLARERQTAAAGLQAQRAELGRDTARLAALMGSSADPAVSGELLPPSPRPVEQDLNCMEQRPDLLALSRRAEAAELEGRAAGRGAIPDVTLGIGSKRVDNGVTQEDGLMLSVSVPLPLFDRQQAGRQRAAAEAMQARATLGLARTRSAGDVQGLHRQTEGLRATALDYRATAVAASAELLRIAETAYQGGESSLLELLDAYRGALDSEAAALELEWRARLAYIEYDLLSGSSECNL